MTLAPAAVLVAILAQGGGTGETRSLRDLYAAAAYDDVLARVAATDPAAITVDHELYAALCHLALGRPLEAEVALERLVRLAPGFELPERDVTPRIIAIFRDVRRRVLPALVREVYRAGRRYFDESRYSEAIAEWREALDLLTAPELAYPADAYADLRELTEGFTRLAERERALAPSPAVRVYTEADAGVSAPVERYRAMPAWVPSATPRAPETYHGQLEITVGLTGRVEQTRVLRTTLPAYDLALMTAARRWRFTPARREGDAVLYRMTFDYVLGPR